MKICVLLRRLRARPDGTGAPALVGICDLAALGAALAAKRQKGAQILVLGAGPAASEEPVLRWALAAGADKAVRVDDPALATVDYWGLARALAGAARSLSVSLVLAGDRSEDEVQGAVGPAVAEALGVQHVTAAHDIEIDTQSVKFTRRDAGAVRTLRLKLPSVLTVASHVGPALAGFDKSNTTAAIQTIDLAAVGLSAAELRHRDRCLGRAHPVRVVRNATLVRDTDDLVARLREDHLLGTS